MESPQSIGQLVSNRHQQRNSRRQIANGLCIIEVGEDHPHQFQGFYALKLKADHWCDSSQ